MKLKNDIQLTIQSILDSAQKRNTEQGLLVCKETLRLLFTASTEQDLCDLIYKFNKAYVGIEAHGDLTIDEYQMICKVRKIENELKKNKNSYRDRNGHH